MLLADSECAIFGFSVGLGWYERPVRIVVVLNHNHWSQLALPFPKTTFHKLMHVLYSTLKYDKFIG